MASELNSDAALDQIKEAIFGYYKDLDNREHGGVAQDRAFKKIERILGMHWVQGASKSIPMSTKELPSHLHDDAPCRVCSKCGRKTFEMKAVACGMTQPNGQKCTGTFEPS